MIIRIITPISSLFSWHCRQCYQACCMLGPVFARVPLNWCKCSKDFTKAVCKKRHGSCIYKCAVLIHSLLTAIHSLRSSPSGSITACLKFPLPSVASACLSSSYWWDPSGMFFFGLKVLDERLPLQGNKHRAGQQCVCTSRTVSTLIWE